MIFKGLFTLVYTTHQGSVAQCTSFQGHPEYSEIQQAKDDMMDLAEYINEVKRDNEMLQIIKDLKVSHG